MGAQLMDNIRPFDIWRRKDTETLVRYRCFEHLETAGFCVQNADFYRAPVTDEYLWQLEKQYLELLLEEDPFSRSGSFASVEEAIEEHDASFED
jgi:hypothetical protein